MFISLAIAAIIRISSTMFLISSPVLLGVWIITLAFIISLTLSALSTSWLGLIMFIIYIGGLLVIFAYFVALTPNLIIDSGTLLVFVCFTLLVAAMLTASTPLALKKRGGMESQAPLMNFLVANPSTVITLALVLFLALVAVVKLSSFSSGPLRPYSY